MNDRGDPAVGLIVIRAWTEGGGQLRFRITQTVDLSAGSTTVSYAASKAAVVEVVEAWLDSFLAIG